MSSSSSCRMYEAVFPSVSNLVIVKVRSTNDLGCYVQLLEYDNLEGFIILSELSKKKSKSNNNHKSCVPTGLVFAAQVTGVDESKGYVDLSKKRVTLDDQMAADSFYQKSKTVHGIMSYLSNLTKIPLLELYTSWGWSLYRNYPHAYDGFKALVENHALFDAFTSFKVVKADLLRIVTHRMAPKSIKLCSNLEITNFSPAGVDGIQKALDAAKSMANTIATIVDKTKIISFKIRYIAAPLYSLSFETSNPKEGIDIMNTICQEIIRVNGIMGGHTCIKTQTKIADQEEEQRLNKMIELAQKETTELEGDEDDED